jgi:predicted TIM-barrel fold metal-dependent hydrolase
MNSATLLGYQLFDADNHYYEPRDAFTRHIEKRYAEKAVRVELDDRGFDRIFIGEEPFRFLFPLFRDAPAPGGLAELMRGKKDDGRRPHYPMRPEYQNRSARLRTMDEQGVESAIMLPTLGVTVEHQMRRDVEGTYANLRSFNRWLEEDWGFSYQNRLFGVPLLSLVDVELAVQELERVLAAGARLVHLRPGPVNGQNPAHPMFDPFWARLNEAEIPVVFHLSESGYNELMSVQWGEQPNPNSHKQSAFQWAMFYGDRPIMDTIAALIYGNLFGRFPRLRAVSIENGTSWLPYLLKRLDKMKGMGRRGEWIGGKPEGRPSDIFRRHFLISPFFEEDHAELLELLGPESIIFGSDWPHPEGLPQPIDYLESLPPSTPPEHVRMIMSDNARALVGLPALV